MIIRRLIVPLTVTVMTIHAGQGLAQSAFPAPLPGRSGAVNDPAFPPVNGTAPGASIGAPVASFPVTGTAPIGAGAGFQPAPAMPSQAGPSDDCMKGFMPLRADAEKRGKLIRAASERHAPPEEACKLIGNFSVAEVKMIKYVESNGKRCQIPPQVSDQLKNGHKNTETMQQKVCAVAQNPQRGPAGPSLSEVLGSAAAVPEATKKGGGSTFDTLNGNVLTR